MASRLYRVQDYGRPYVLAGAAITSKTLTTAAAFKNETAMQEDKVPHKIVYFSHKMW